MPLPRFVLLYALLVTAGLVAACQPGAPPTPSQPAAVDTAAIGAALDSLAQVVTRANQTGDAELFASTWARDGAMSTPGAPLVRGREAIVAAFRARPPLPPGASLTIHPMELRVLSADWAYAFGVDSLRHVPEQGAEPVVETSTFLVLIRKTDAGWQTYREVLSANEPPGRQE